MVFLSSYSAVAKLSYLCWDGVLLGTVSWKVLHTHTLFLSLFFSLSLSLSHTCTCVHIHNCYTCVGIACFLALLHARCYTHTLTHTLSLSHTHTHTLTCARARTHTTVRGVIGVSIGRGEGKFVLLKLAF